MQPGDQFDFGFSDGTDTGMQGYHVQVTRDTPNGRVREHFCLLHDVAFGLAGWPARYEVLDYFTGILRMHLLVVNPNDGIVVSSPSYGFLRSTVLESAPSERA